jgi:hypothetical protein
MPVACEKLQNQLGFSQNATSLATPANPIPDNHPIGEIFPLFPRKDK